MSRSGLLFFIAFMSLLSADSRLVLDCPLPQLGQNKTTASAFLYADGQPATNATMVLAYVLNETYGFETLPVSLDAATGRHDFIIDTRFGGTYNLTAFSANLASNTCFLAVFEKQAEKIPELPAWLAWLAAAGAFALLRHRIK